MIRPISISKVQVRMNAWTILLALTYVAIGIIGLNDYVSFYSINFLVGFLTIVMVINADKTFTRSSKYAFLALFFSVVCLLIPGRTILYFALSSTLLFLLERFTGSLSFRPFIVIILASPIFKYASDIFSFPIRLELTNWAASILSIVGDQTEAIGNIIYHNGTEMSVDPECMGLNMIVTSTLAGVMMFAVFAKKFQKQISSWKLVAFLGIMILLNVFSNLLRIITLVYLSIQPGSLGHEIVGISSFLVYVILPGIFLAKWIVNNCRSIHTNSRERELINKKYPWTHVPLAIALSLALASVKNQDSTVSTAVPALQIKDYATTRMSGEILKLESKNSLVYLKYIPGFYNADHNPMICWRGSGYNFTKVRTEEINGSVLYTAELDRSEEKLMTAWWYENGSNRTIEQLDWRKDVLMGAKNYYLVNVTSSSYTGLIQEITRIQSSKELQSYFLKEK